ncbi:MAG: flagellar type III secretion system protein FliR [Firmicutes bacterium]|nr:flagellar type III secretion system protein FliR [Bacillota bacterium]
MSDDLFVWTAYLFLMFLRISAIFTISPVFGRRNMPNIAKLGLSLLIAYISISAFPPAQSNSFENVVQYAMLCFGELSIGLIIGIITTVFFSAVHTAGQLIDMQIGFSFVQIFEQSFGGQIPIMGSLLQSILLICFFAADGHHALIRLIGGTFETIPVGNAAINPQIAMHFTQIFITTFVLAVKIAMPIIAASLLAEVMLGVLIRTVPQMNFFVIGFPIKIGLGLLVLFAFIPVFVNMSNQIFDGMLNEIKSTFSLMAV